MYQRSINFCKQPPVVVENVILLAEIAETYGLRQERADTCMGCGSTRARGTLCMTGCCLLILKRHGRHKNVDDFLFLRTTWLTTQSWTKAHFPRSSCHYLHNFHLPSSQREKKKKKTIPWHETELLYFLFITRCIIRMVYCWSIMNLSDVEVFKILFFSFRDENSSSKLKTVKLFPEM